MHNQWVEISTMRVIIVTTVVYVGLLLVFLGVRQYQLNVTLHQWIVNDTMKMIASRPVDHRHTLFSGVLIEQFRNTLPYLVHSESVRAALYELVALSPCNPRIHNCS